jgi:RimJ/RimL family protein N-acetyltransferase
MANASNTKKRSRAEGDTDRLIGERIALRRVSPADLAVLQAWDEDPEIEALMGRRFAATDAAEWLRAVSRGRTCRAWVIEDQEGRPIGELELAHLNWRMGSAELRVCIGERTCWNHGYGTDAIRTALAGAFGRLGLQSVYLRVFATNARAVRVYEKLGFRKQAILQPSSRREDPAAVILMNLTANSWHIRNPQRTKLPEGIAGEQTLSLTSHG